MRCREVVELMTDYIEGALSESDRARFEAHLSTCDGCTRYLEHLRTTIRLSGKLGADTIPPELEAELLNAFKDWKSRG